MRLHRLLRPIEVRGEAFDTKVSPSESASGLPERLLQPSS
jgi:hypothetical protein